MEFEDSRNALFCDPNAYIQRFDVENKCKPKKVIFQEPYESLPAFYLDNNFIKHECDCVLKHKHDNNYNHGNKQDMHCNHSTNCEPNDYFFKKGFYNHNISHDCNCNRGNKNYNQCEHGDNCNKDNSKQNGFSFDLKSLLPLLGLFNKGGGSDLSSIVGLLNKTGSTNNNSNPIGLISSLMSNKDLMGGILNLFKGGGLNLFNKKQSVKKELKTTDFEIKNYTRVE